jgi:hypothetical protein
MEKSRLWPLRDGFLRNQTNLRVFPRLFNPRKGRRFDPQFCSQPFALNYVQCAQNRNIQAAEHKLAAGLNLKARRCRLSLIDSPAES